MTFFLLLLYFCDDHFFCCGTNANVMHDFLFMLAMPANVIKALNKTALLVVSFAGGGVDDITNGVFIRMFGGCIFLTSTNAAMRLATLLIFLLHSSVALISAAFANALLLE